MTASVPASTSSVCDVTAALIEVQNKLFRRVDESTLKVDKILSGRFLSRGRQRRKSVESGPLSLCYLHRKNDEKARSCKLSCVQGNC